MTPFREVDGWSLLYREKRKPGRKPDNKRRRKWSVPRRKNSRGNEAMIYHDALNLPLDVTAKTQHNFRVKNSHEIILDTVRELLCTGAIWPPRQQHAEKASQCQKFIIPGWIFINVVVNEWNECADHSRSGTRYHSSPMRRSIEVDLWLVTAWNVHKNYTDSISTHQRR